jgi:hypothetical protein
MGILDNLDQLAQPGLSPLQSMLLGGVNAVAPYANTTATPTSPWAALGAAAGGMGQGIQDQRAQALKQMLGAAQVQHLGTETTGLDLANQQALLNLNWNRDTAALYGGPNKTAALAGTGTLAATAPATSAPGGGPLPGAALLRPYPGQTINPPGTKEVLAATNPPAVPGAPAPDTPQIGQGLTLDDTVNRMLGFESTGDWRKKPDYDAQNPNSSAGGAGQFIDKTFVSTFRNLYPDRAKGMSDDQILGLKFEPSLAQPMTKALAQDSIAQLQKQGLPTGPGEVYLSHFLGAGGAAKVLQADPNTPIKELIPPGKLQANDLDGRMTAADFRALVAKRIGVAPALDTAAGTAPLASARAPQPGSLPPPPPADPLNAPRTTLTGAPSLPAFAPGAGQPLPPQLRSPLLSGPPQGPLPSLLPQGLRGPPANVSQPGPLQGVLQRTIADGGGAPGIGQAPPSAAGGAPAPAMPPPGAAPPPAAAPMPPAPDASPAQAPQAPVVRTAAPTPSPQVQEQLVNLQRLAQIATRNLHSPNPADRADALKSLVEIAKTAPPGYHVGADGNLTFDPEYARGQGLVKGAETAAQFPYDIAKQNNQGDNSIRVEQNKPLNPRPGTPVINPATGQVIWQDSPENAADLKNLAEETKQSRLSYESARLNNARLDELSTKVQDINNGPLRDIVGMPSRVLAELGFGGIRSSAPANEVFDKIVAQSIGDLTKGLDQNSLGALQQMKNAFVNRGMSTPAIVELVQSLKGLNDYNIAKHEGRIDYMNHNGLSARNYETSPWMEHYTPQSFIMQRQNGLAAPAPVFKSPGDPLLSKMPSGTHFLDGNGNLRTVP